MTSLLTDTAGDMGGRDVMKWGVMEADVVELDMAKWEFETGGCVYIYILLARAWQRFYIDTYMLLTFSACGSSKGLSTTTTSQ
jgi:hypothetical protein